MRLKKIALYCVFAGLGLILSPVDLCASATIASALSNADAIVVGTVSGWSESADGASFTINVMRVLRGDATQPTVDVMHHWTSRALVGLGQAATPVSVSRTVNGIWLLRRETGSGTWDVTPTRAPDGIFYNLFWPAAGVMPASYQYPGNADSTDKLVFELAAGLEATGGDTEYILGATRNLNTPAVQTVLTRFSQAASPTFRAVGVSGLLERGQPGSVSMLIQLWPAVSGDVKISDMLISVVRDHLRNTDPTVVREVAGLAAAGLSQSLRAAAVASLAAIHTREALPLLATLLKSSDQEEQMKGVYGLSSFANGCPVQTQDNIKTLTFLQCNGTSQYRTKEAVANFAFRRGPASQESALVSFWLTWWNTHPELH
jgi:hypothetical protein